MKSHHYSQHAAALKAHGIRPIDLLVVNLYPFEETIAKGADNFSAGRKMLAH